MQDYYQKLSHLPGFVLLESTDKSRGRYDIVSAYPYDSIKITAQTRDIGKIVQSLSQEISLKPSVADLPFQGGAIGYISYDFGERLLGIHSTPPPGLSAMPLLNLGMYDWAIIVDHHLQQTTLFAAQTQSETEHIVAEVMCLWKEPIKAKAKGSMTSVFCPILTKEEYGSALATIKQALHKGRCYQVNYTQPFHAHYEGDAWTFYRKISKKNPVPFSAFLRMDEADILSFSPERFLLYDKGKLLTSPIKGTIRRSADPSIDGQLQQELVTSEKNIAENVMIVDLLRNDLGKIAQPGSVHVSALCALESYNSVHHLVSTIEAQCLPEIQPFSAFLSCFPGGSITGAPKLEAMHMIHELELHSRGIYCGSIGFFSRHGYFDTNIAIRTVTATNERLHLAVGGGIVMDSEPEDEYQECFIKIAAVINGLKET
ncbi:MAG: aminodeoxychorismate synthase component I [Legionella sp.]